MSMDFIVKDLTNTAVLGSSGVSLPDDVLDEIDNISISAKEFFGKNIRPTLQQERIMASKGFPVRSAKEDIAGWKVGAIETPKGLIHYS